MVRKLTSRQAMIVGYLRTSTKDQLLSIDAQRETVDRIAHGFNCEVVRTFIEHESGGDNDRVELGRAIKHARRIGATVVVAKLDRLARDSTFLMQLYDGNVPIVFGDLPEVDGLTASGRASIQFMATMAEFERRRQGERMKDWHRERKSQGFKAGTPANLTPEAKAKGVRQSAINRRAQSLEDMSDVIPVVEEMKAAGATLQQIADRLNKDKCVTRQGGEWHPTQVRRLLKRSESNA